MARVSSALTNSALAPGCPLRSGLVEATVKVPWSSLTSPACRSSGPKSMLDASVVVVGWNGDAGDVAAPVGPVVPAPVVPV